MTDQFTKPFADLFKAELPEQFQAMVQDGIAKSREVAVKSIAAVKDGAETLGKANPIAAKETSALTAKAFEQALTNTELAYDAAQSLARAKSPVEAAQIQAQFVQANFARAGEQAKELFELTTKLAQKTGEDMAQFAAKSGAGFKA